MIELRTPWTVELKDGRKGLVLALADLNTMLVAIKEGEEHGYRLEVHPRDAMVLTGRLGEEAFVSVNPEQLDKVGEWAEKLISAMTPTKVTNVSRPVKKQAG